MTIRQIAILIVSQYCHSSPGSESSLIQIENEEKKLRETLMYDGHGNRIVQVEVDDTVIYDIPDNYDFDR